LSRIAGRMGSQGNLSPQVKKSWNTTTSLASGVGVCSSRGARSSSAGKNPTASYSLIRFAVTLDSPKTKDGGYDLELFAAISFLGSASTSARSFSAPDVPSDLISPSSRFSESGQCQELGYPLKIECSRIRESLLQWTKYQQRLTLRKSLV
jgi:hypothetical protein